MMMRNGANRLRVGGKVKPMVQTTGKAMLLALLVLVQSFHFCSGSPGSSLRYDDGGAECFWSDYYPNGITVRFTPPASIWRITSILVYGFAMDRGAKVFIIEVRDSGFNPIFRSSYPVSEFFKNATLDWARLPLPNILVKGDFHACVYPMLEPNGTQLCIAVDRDTFSGRSFLVDCYAERVSKYEDGNMMVRVEAEEAASLVEIIADTISVEEKVLELTFRVAPPGNVTGAKAILQTGSMMEECEVILENGFYRVGVEWPRLSGLKEPARLILSVKTLNSTATLAIRLGETLFSKHLRLRGENRFLKAMVNNSRLEREALEHMLEGKEADVTVLKASLEAHEKKWLEEVKETGKLARELNVMRLLTGFLGLSTILPLIVLLREKTHAD
ncbi:MAG: hypothetical protein FGF51_05750 [Candidatus Brockarchaeota archaeon]|nr:hypothetical protein [Candidatus Brockarchaeota archaeon]